MNDTSSHFQNIFSSKIQASANANARANLIGDHTDYNNGLVLPVLLGNKTIASVSLRSDLKEDEVELFSFAFQKSDEAIVRRTIVRRTLNEKKQNHWSDFPVGVLREIKKHMRKPLPGLCILLESEIPSGAGVSSSAALEIAILRAVNSLLDIELGELRIAKMAQRSENEYVGMPCGLMDQMVISMGMENYAMCIDFYNSKQASYEFAPLFSECIFLLISSGRNHQLASGDEGYASRVLQCKKAAGILNIPHLSYLQVEDLKNLKLEEILQKRVEHVVRENQRVRDAYTALLSKDYTVFARLMNESHASLRDLYQTSIPEIDMLCETALKSGALAARLTGGGFGGSIIVLTMPEKKEQVLYSILSSDTKSFLLAELQAKFQPNYR